MNNDFEFYWLKRILVDNMIRIIWHIFLEHNRISHILQECAVVIVSTAQTLKPPSIIS